MCNMKKILLIFLPFYFLSCSDNLHQKLEGNWIIAEMTFKGKSVYPETITDEIEITLNIAGYENAEKVKFINKHSAVVLPGFGSGRITVDFIIDENKIRFKEHQDVNYTDKAFALTKRIFLTEYEIVRSQKNGELILKSDSTTLRILNEKVIIENSLGGVFNEL